MLLSIPSPTSHPLEISRFLENLSNSIETSIRPHIYQRPVSFSNSTVRQNWISFLPAGDAVTRATFNDWYKDPKKGQQVRLILFSSPCQNWVGMPVDEWELIPWHMWAVTIITAQNRQNHGMIVIFYDPEPRKIENPQCKHTQKRIHNIIQPYQRAFWDFLNKKGRPARIFYSIDQTGAGQERCMEYTTQWLVRIAQVGDIPFQGALGDSGITVPDERISKCTELVRR